MVPAPRTDESCRGKKETQSPCPVGAEGLTVSNQLQKPHRKGRYQSKAGVRQFAVCPPPWTGRGRPPARTCQGARIRPTGSDQRSAATAHSLFQRCTASFRLGAMATTILKHGLDKGKGPGEWLGWPRGFQTESKGFQRT